MDNNSTKDAASLFSAEAWFDPIEAELRERVRGFLEEMVEQESTIALGRSRYQRGAGGGYRNGARSRRLLGSFGPIEIAVPRARLFAADGTSREWRSTVLPRYARMTRQVEALIASTYLAGTNTRRVKRALATLFKGAVGKDVVSRVWRKVKTDWEAWTRRDLANEDIVRLILDGSVVRVRLDRRATNISLLVALGIRRDGQKVLLAVRNMGGESEAAWLGVLNDLIARGLRTPEFLIIDGAAGLEKALAALWPEVPTQRCTVHKHRNLLAHAPDSLHDEISADYNDMIYAKTVKEIEVRRRAFLRKWRLKCRAVAQSLEEAGDRLFTFTRLSQSHMWTAPFLQGVSAALIRSLASICPAFRALAYERWPRWFPRQGFQTMERPVEATGFLGVSRVVDRLITPSAHCLASSGIGSARLHLSCSPCLADLWTATAEAARP